MSVSRTLLTRSVRRSVPREGWDLFYGAPQCAPLHLATGKKVLYQATRFPSREREALVRAEKATGGRGDMSASELRARERELRQVDLIHVTTHAVQAEFLEAGFPEERLVHAYPGVDLEQHRPGPKKGDLRVAFIGPLSLRKGVDIACDIARRLQGKGIVEAVGGPTCPWSRRISEEAPFLMGRSAPETLASAQALILPSRSDGFSYVVLEALASGTVPIVTPAVGAAEVVRRLDPRLVLEEDVFAEAAVELLDGLDLIDIGQRARELALVFDRNRAAPAIAEAILTRLDTQESAPDNR
jgi:glycosyltransferase involved in cell wall biosynthesis